MSIFDEITHSQIWVNAKNYGQTFFQKILIDELAQHVKRVFFAKGTSFFRAMCKEPKLNSYFHKFDGYSEETFEMNRRYLSLSENGKHWRSCLHRFPLKYISIFFRSFVAIKVITRCSHFEKKKKKNPRPKALLLISSVVKPPSLQKYSFTNNNSNCILHKGARRRAKCFFHTLKSLDSGAISDAPTKKKENKHEGKKISFWDVERRHGPEKKKVNTTAECWGQEEIFYAKFVTRKENE